MEEKNKRIEFLVREHSNVPAAQFVRAVNDCYYRHRASQYDATPDIAHDAVIAWKQVIAALKDSLPNIREYTVIDIGSGTGFVAERVVESGIQVRKYVGFEPSEHMRSVAQQKITDERISFQALDLAKKTSESISSIAGKKIVTMNSVLHHIVWWEYFLVDLVNSLQAEDIFVLCHEPNSRFWENSKLVDCFDTIVKEKKTRPRTRYFNPLNYLRKLQQLTGLDISGNGSMIELVNSELKATGTLKKELLPDMLGAIIDYGVPLCWRNISYDSAFDEGFFSIERISNEYLRGCRIVHAFTYQHLGFSPSVLTGNWRRFAAEMSETVPDDGAQFCLVAIKK